MAKIKSVATSKIAAKLSRCLEYMKMEERDPGSSGSSLEWWRGYKCALMVLLEEDGD